MVRGIEMPRIVKAGVDDLKVLCDVGVVTQCEAYDRPEYMQYYSKHDVDEYNHRAFSEDQIRRELTNPYSEFYLLLDDDGCDMGFCKLNFSGAHTEPDMGLDSLEVQRIYVRQKFQGRAFGTMLFEFAINRAREAKMRSLWLGVWDVNTAAIRFYEKFGLKRVGEQAFQFGEVTCRDWLMSMPIEPLPSVASPSSTACTAVPIRVQPMSLDRSEAMLSGVASR